MQVKQLPKDRFSDVVCSTQMVTFMRIYFHLELTF